VKSRLIDLLKKHEFDSALPLLSAMKETWPSDAMFKASPVTQEDSADSSMSTDDDLTCRLTDLLGCLQHVFFGEPLILICVGQFKMTIFIESPEEC